MSMFSGAAIAVNYYHAYLAGDIRKHCLYMTISPSVYQLAKGCVTAEGLVVLLTYVVKFFLAQFQSDRLSPSSTRFSIKLNFPLGADERGRGVFSNGIVFITAEQNHPKGKGTCLATIFQPGPERFVPIGLLCIVDEEEKVPSMVIFMIEPGKMPRKPHPQSRAGHRMPFIDLINGSAGVLFLEATV